MVLICKFTPLDNFYFADNFGGLANIQRGDFKFIINYHKYNTHGGFTLKIMTIKSGR